MEINKIEFGKRLRRLRKAKKLTARELGEKIGAAESTVIGYEGGARSPNHEKLRSLSNALGVSTDFLLHGNESDPRNLRNVFEQHELTWDGYKLREEDIEQIKIFAEFVILRSKKDEEI